MKRPKLTILFGSRARGTAGENSDTDITALAERELTLSDKVRLTERIARKFGWNEDRIDLIDLRQAPPLLAQNIAQTGKLIEGSDLDFTRFKVLAWKKYQDTARFRRARERSLKKFFAAARKFIPAYRNYLKIIHRYIGK